jgi:hypothetical protein
LPADQRWALLRRCLTDARLSTPLRVAGSPVLLYGQTPTRIVTLTQHDVTRLEGMTYITLHRQPVLMPTRLADLVGQLGESSTAHPRALGSGRAVSPWLFPGARLGAHQRAGYLGTSLNEQLGLQIRPGRGGALCDLADELPPQYWPHCSASQSTPPAGGARL